VILGGSFHHVFPGIPESSRSLAFFESQGYTLGKVAWDVWLQGDPIGIEEAALAVKKARIRAEILKSGGQTPIHAHLKKALLAFLEKEFPGRWHYEISAILKGEIASSATLCLFEGERAIGFTQMHEPGSPAACRWEGFDPEIASIGPVGLAGDQRGRGLGLAMVVIATQHLRHQGLKKIVIDWTDLIDFYGKLGYQPWQSYRLAEKSL
jgi:predicted N-acetyltransferase YhbS